MTGWLKEGLGLTSGHPSGSSEHDIQADPGWRVWTEGRKVLVKHNLREGQRTGTQGQDFGPRDDCWVGAWWGKREDPSLGGLANQGRNGKQARSPRLELRPRWRCGVQQAPAARLTQRGPEEL